jgi:hypothetical protein
VNYVPTESFAPTGTEVEQLLQYPYTRPDSSFITMGENVALISDDYNQFCTQTNEVLAEKNLPLLQERIPVIAYGANANPFRQVVKLSKFTPENDEQRRVEMQTVPTITAQVLSAQIVWHGIPGQAGSAFAELYPGKHDSDCFVSFFTPLQLAVMHTTEGATYNLGEIPVTLGTGAEPATAFVYVPAKSHVLMRGGQAVRVQAPGVDGQEGSLDANDAVQYMLDGAGSSAVPDNPISYIEAGQTMKLAEKKARQVHIAELLMKHGISESFTYPLGYGSTIGRADFNSIVPSTNHDMLRLAEQIVAPLRPTSQQIINRQTELIATGVDPTYARKEAYDALDPMQIIRIRAHDELERRLVA